jgi:hypothetical protein
MLVWFRHDAVGGNDAERHNNAVLPAVLELVPTVVRHNDGNRAAGDWEG